jgi:hypothetical protein
VVVLTDILLGFFFLLFCYGMVAARTSRQLLAVTLAGVLILALTSPPPVQAQSSLITAIQSVLNVINGKIQTALTAINKVRSTLDRYYQEAIWPVALINQARSLVAQMTGQYRDQMVGIVGMNLKSATLPDPIALESVLRNHQTSDLASVATLFGNAFGGVPTTTTASPADRTMMDMDDALAMDTLKMLKESDSADDLALEAASSIEDQVSQAAPGSAPFLTATAVAATIQSQALTQKMLAAQLRQEAARLAHENALRKRGATITGDVSTQILNLLQRH